MIKAEIYTSTGINIEGLEKAMENSGTQSIASVDMRLFGSSEEIREHYRGVERVKRHAQKIKLEVILPKKTLPVLLDALKENIGSSSMAEMKVFTSPMQSLMTVD